MTTRQYTYKRCFLTTTISLLVLAGILFALTQLQGPRIRALELDPHAAEYTDRLLILRTNQALKDVTKEDISLTPAASFTANIKGSTVAIRFNERLSYATTYTVRITAKRTLSRSFTTQPGEMYYLTNPTQDDKKMLRRYNVLTKKDQLVLNHKEIIDYTILEKSIVVVIRQTEDDYRVIRINKQTNATEHIQLPHKGVIDSIHASPDGKTFGIALSYEANDTTKSNLLLYQPDKRQFATILDAAQKPIETINWAYAPDGISVIVHDTTMAIHIADIQTKQSTALLGQYSALLGVSADSQKIIVFNQRQFLAYDRSKRNTTEITTPLDRQYIVNSLEPLLNQSGYTVMSGTYSDKIAMQQIFITQGGTYKQLFEGTTDQGIIGTIAPSPNDQYVAVSVQKKRTAFTFNTNLIEARTGKQIATFEGGNPAW